MESPSLKEKIIESMRQLPTEATIEDAMERLVFLAKLERGLSESNSGPTVPHEDVKKRYSK